MRTWCRLVGMHRYLLSCQYGVQDDDSSKVDENREQGTFRARRQPGGPSPKAGSTAWSGDPSTAQLGTVIRQLSGNFPGSFDQQDFFVCLFLFNPA